eukprot:405603-Rhodomonas_salina.1
MISNPPSLPFADIPFLVSPAERLWQGAATASAAKRKGEIAGAAARRRRTRYALQAAAAPPHPPQRPRYLARTFGFVTAGGCAHPVSYA